MSRCNRSPCVDRIRAIVARCYDERHTRQLGVIVKCALLDCRAIVRPVVGRPRIVDDHRLSKIGRLGDYPCPRINRTSRREVVLDHDDPGTRCNTICTGSDARYVRPVTVCIPLRTRR